MRNSPKFGFYRFFLLSPMAAVVVWSAICFGQTEAASIYGRISDQSGAVVPGAEVRLHNIDTNVDLTRKTNQEGFYLLPALKPGRYLMVITKRSFKTVTLKDITINVQDNISRNFSLEVGSASESVTVTAEGATINTTDATVSTVVDRQFAENLPMNGRSFQTLIELTPGVVLTPSTPDSAGQFSVNGQRSSSNYWMVDGVSANIGVSTSFIPGQGIGGALPASGVQGGTNSLVSVDAMQEFRIQTSTYAPEFGRTPGGQISIATRAGTNQFSGTVFDYFRNDVLDANDWFADNAGLPKPRERQNDFGGTLGGPLVKNRTFFFFSYEGLRLALPAIAQTTVPSLSARQNAIPTMQPFLNAFPMPNGTDLGNGIAQFNSSFSNSSSLNAYSLRVDQKRKDKIALFGRYNYSPSTLVQRGFSGNALSNLFSASTTTQTATIGLTWLIAQTLANELRFNYSAADSSGKQSLDNFGGAVPLTSLPFPGSFGPQNSQFSFLVESLGFSGLNTGKLQHIVQRQINIVDNLSFQRGSHSLKFGIDFRRLAPQFDPQLYFQEGAFSDVPSAEVGNLLFSDVRSATKATLYFHNLGLFAQDAWRALPRLTLTYGVRWDLDFAPSSNPSFLALTNFNDVSRLALAPAGTPPFSTTYGNVAPRLGVAYELVQSQTWSTVLRGGFGVFYDLATSQMGNLLSQLDFPFGADNFLSGGSFPLPSAVAAPPQITTASLSSGFLHATDPNLELPYTWQWNLAVQQSFGKQQTVAVSYVGSAGRRLLQSALTIAPNPTFGDAILVRNSANSDYHALQIQFQRSLANGLQALASYTWSHSIDTASNGSLSSNLDSGSGNGFVKGTINRGSSDFDIRHALSAGFTYDIPTPKRGRLLNAIWRGWSLQDIIQARSAPPVDLFDSNLGVLLQNVINVRPDVVSGQPFYLTGPQYPGGRAFNRSAFTDPPLDNNGNPLRQGDLGRNRLRGFGAFQWDCAVHREFQIHENVRLQFRAELFNVLNHPNFGEPIADLSDPRFGRSIQTLAQSLAGGTFGNNLGGGAFDPLYQVGGPRSAQFALKLLF
jgi:hypothetical protein